MELPLFGAEVLTGRARLFRIPDDVDHPLEGDGERLKVRMRLEGLHGPDLLLRPDQIVDPRGQDGVHDVVGMALGDELVFEPALEEFQDIGLRLIGGRFRSGPRMARLSSIRRRAEAGSVS